MDQKFVEVIRAGEVESVHFGTAVAMHSNGDVLAEWGNADRQVFPRSSMKPFQSLVMAETGVQLSTEQWALSGASHDGEEMHITRVKTWLADMGLSADDLVCGPAWPAHGKSRKAMIERGEDKSRLIHNCSGKHCGHLATCQHMGWDLGGYDSQSHPFQMAMLDRFSDLTDAEPTAIGIDGCSLPAPRTALRNFALGLARFAALVDDGNEAAGLVFGGAVTFPELTGGSKQMNGRITKAGRGAYYAKTGAEGMFSVIIPEKKVGIAIKASDGSSRGSEVIIAGVLVHVLTLLGMDADPIRSFCEYKLQNAAGLNVGAVRFAG